MCASSHVGRARAFVGFGFYSAMLYPGRGANSRFDWLEVAPRSDTYRKKHVRASGCRKCTWK